MKVTGTNMAPHQGILGWNHRKTLKNIQKSSSEQLDSDARKVGNIVQMVALG